MSPSSTNDDEHFAMEENINYINMQSAGSNMEISSNSLNPAKSIRAQYKLNSNLINNANKSESNRDVNSGQLLISSSLSLSSSVASSSVPSSISPSATSSPRLFQQPTQSNSSNTLMSNTESIKTLLSSTQLFTANKPVNQ